MSKEKFKRILAVVYIQGVRLDQNQKRFVFFTAGDLLDGIINGAFCPGVRNTRPLDEKALKVLF